MADSGLNPGRLALEWASAAEGPRFVELVTGFVSRIRALGPFGSAEGEADAATLSMRLKAAVKAAEAPKVRTSIGNLAKKMHEAGDYSLETISKEVADKVLSVFQQERLGEEVLMRLGDERGYDFAALKGLTGASDELLDKTLQGLAKKGAVKEGGQGWALAQ